MKLSLRTWGGFTGPAGAVTRTVDMDALSEGPRRHALALIEAAHPFDRPDKLLLSAPRSWDFNHVLEVQDGARTKHLQLHLEAVDAPLRALVEWIERTGEPVGNAPAP